MQNPVEVDTKLADLYEAQAESAFQHDRWAKVKVVSPRHAEEADVEMAKAAEANHAAVEAAQPLEAIYREEQWERYYLVRNVGGHVHKSRRCSSCFQSTEFSWLVQYSGMSEAEFVQFAGEDACTVCFPDAPVSVLSQPSRLSTPEREAKAAEKAAREVRKAELAAKKAANAICNPDGSEVRFGSSRWDVAKTVTEAKWQYDSARFYSQYSPHEANKARQREAVALLSVALEYKLGAEAFAAYVVRVDKKIAKDMK